MAVTIVRTTSSSQLNSLLTQASASTTYLTQASASITYLTQSSASSTYAPIIPTVPTSFRNILINGGLDVWQRGTGNYTASGYTADRFYSPISGATVSRESSDLPAGFTSGIKFVTSGASQFAQFNQALESFAVIPLRGKTVTVSGYVKITGSFTGNWVSQALYSTSSDAYASQTVTISGSVKTVATSETTSWTRFSNTFTVPSDAVGLRIENIPVSAQPTGVTVRMTGIQLEEGSSATPFEHTPFGLDLLLCQRYYQTSFAGSGVTPGHNASGNGIIYHPGVSGGISGNIYTNIRFPFMRTSPAVNIWNGNNASATPATAALTGGLNTSASGMRIYTAGGVGYDSTNIGIDYIRNDSISIYAQASTGGAASGILAFGYSLNAEL